MKKDVIELRSKQVTDTQLQERVMQGQKTVECLNNKLDTIIKRFCTIIAANHRLRDNIDHLLIERSVLPSSKVGNQLAFSTGQVSIKCGND